MDEVWREVGAFGPFQWAVVASLPLAVLASGGNFLLSSFLIMEPEWACPLPGQAPNSSTLSWGRNCSVWSECESPSLRREFYSVTEEWGLVCDRSYIAHSIVSLQNMPTWAGLLFWGPVSDGFGRKPAALASTLVTILASLGAVTASSWQSFTAFRMLFGFMFAGASNVFIVWAMELTDQKHSFLVNALTHWHYTYMVVAGLAYATRDWQGYLIALNVLVSPVILLFAFLFTESPRWLMRKGRLEEAREALGRIARWNKGAAKLTLTTAQLREADEAEHVGSSGVGKSEASRNFLALFATRERRIHSAALGLTFVAASVTSGTIILDVGQLSGGAYQNLFLIGFFRVFTPLISVAADKAAWLGRRPFFFAANAVVLGCFFAVLAAQTLLPALVGASAAASLSAGLSLAGAICNMFVWIVIMQLAFELYPTLLRNTAIAYTGLADSTGAVLVPQILYLRRFWRAGPTVVAIGLVLCSVAVGYAVYPETKASAAPPSRAQAIADLDVVPLLEAEDSEEENQLW